MSAEQPFRVTVYASASERVPAAYFAAAERLGRCIAERGWELVWGGVRFGLMGAVSRGARAAGGRTRGVILERFLAKNAQCPEAYAMSAEPDMRSRKRGLDESGDAFVALPGGLGTLEELAEILSFKQLGYHGKPVVILDVDDYWQPLLEMFERGFAQGFIQPQFRGLYTVAKTPEQAVEQIASAPVWDVPMRDPHGGGSG